MAFEGSCHCGAIRFTVDEDVPTQSMACNCSICRRSARLHHFTTPDKVTLTVEEGAVGTYRFNKHAIDHHFCTRCGIQTHGGGATPDGQRMVNLNLRCVDGLDPDSLQVQHYDGASL